MNISNEIDFMRCVNPDCHNILDCPIYVISLPKAIQRRRDIKDNASSNGLSINIVDGVRITKREYEICLPCGLTVNFDDKRMLIGVTMGELGCTLAHLSTMYDIYKQCSETKENYNIVICEDDIVFDPLRLLSTPLSYFAEMAPNDWEILQLQPTNNPSNLSDPYSTNKSYGTVCYCINMKAIKQFFDNHLNGSVINMSRFYGTNIRADHFLYTVFKTYTNYKHVYVLWNNTLHSSQIHPSMNISHIKRSKLAAQKSIRDYIETFFSKHGDVCAIISVCGMVMDGKIERLNINNVIDKLLVSDNTSIRLLKTFPKNATNHNRGTRTKIGTGTRTRIK